MRPESRTITTSPITPDLFEQLYVKHSKTLSCPCSKDAIPYKVFVSTIIKFHPVCSSIFIREEWSRTLYLSDASRYGTLDFRTTANFQVNENDVKRFFSISFFIFSSNFSLVFVYFHEKQFLKIK